MNLAESINPTIFNLYDNVSKSPSQLLQLLARLLNCEKISIIKRADSFAYQASNEETSIEIPELSIPKLAINTDARFLLSDCFAHLLFKSDHYTNVFLSLEYTTSEQARRHTQRRELACLIPHIQQALNMSYQLTQQESDLKSVHYVLDHYPIPSIAIDNHFDTIFSNQAANKLLNFTPQNTLENMPDVLSACSCSKQKQTLKQCLVKGLSQELSHSRFLTINFNDIESPIIVSPVESVPNVFRHFSRDNIVWVYILSPDYSHTLKSHPEFQKLGLSTTETLLASHLFEGLSLNDISVLRCVSKQTVRKQLQSILRKTACESQESLMIFFFEQFIHYGLNR